MNKINACEIIHHAMIEFAGVTSSIHQFGGTEYKLGKREIGHVHGNFLVDIPFPMQIRNDIVGRGEAEPHHILPDSGWVSVHLRNESDIERAITLLEKSYKLALEQKAKRINEKEY